MNTLQFSEFFRPAESIVDVDRIQHYWHALSPHYDVNHWDLPLPPWRHCQYDDSGEQAWHVLVDHLTTSTNQNAFCIYIHTPFCSTKCGFCDSYSFKLGSQQAQHIDRYVDRLCYELRLWSQLGNLSQRAVSTVHIGGGTPTFIGEGALERLVNCCKSEFNITHETEFALESTVQPLTPRMIQTMHDLGYRRLHIGVQSLEESVRTAIGRRSPREQVLKVIQTCLTQGWVVSVDLICGLPHQTLRGFLDGIQALIDLGVNGFSLYELLIFPQNRRWCEAHHLDKAERHLPNYWMFTAGNLLLEARGFRKNLFNHWADQNDANIYFTFPQRQEDLLAVGSIADGLFGDYHYRHPRYAQYMQGSQGGFPGLEGGLRRNSLFNVLHTPTIAIQSGHISGQVAPIIGTWADDQGKNVFDRWLHSQLIHEDGQGGWELTPNGSWFAGNMISELRSNY